MSIVRPVVVVAIAALLLWRVLVVGLFAPQAPTKATVEGGGAGGKSVERGVDRLKAALSRDAAPEVDEQAPPVMDALQRAFERNPTDPQPLLRAAALTLDAGDSQQADALIEMAVRLRPADPAVHLRAARYWLAREDAEQALRHWLAALEADPSRSKEVFPLMRQVVDDAETREVMMQLALTPPAWWPEFFAYLAEHASGLEPVKQFYEMRSRMSVEPMTELERKHYVRRLNREGLVVDAYLAWLNGLSLDRRWALGLVHDGNFESEPTGWGFDWRMDGSETVLVDVAKTYGISGDHALHVLFNDHEGAMVEVAQTLFLDPGDYRLTGRYRADRLATRGGLRWIVQCLRPEPALLDESQRFLGSNKWDSFDLEFSVPRACKLQELRLVSVDDAGLYRAVSGGIWFDQMVVRQIAPGIGATAAVLPADGGSSEPVSDAGEGDGVGAERGDAGVLVLAAEGDVLVTQGGRYVMAKEGQELARGDRVITLRGGNAVLEYATGCRELINENRLLTIGANEPSCEPPVTAHD